MSLEIMLQTISNKNAETPSRLCGLITLISVSQSVKYYDIIYLLYTRNKRQFGSYSETSCAERHAATKKERG